MKNNKPVFESFNEFIKFVHSDAIYESVKIEDLSDLQTTLGSLGMDKVGKKALTEIESLAEQSGAIFSAADLSQIGIVLGKLTTPDVTTITRIDVSVEEFYYDNLMGGAVKTQKGDKVGLAQFLTQANKENLKPLSEKIPQINIDKDRFELDGDKKFIPGSGVIGQYLPVQIDGTLDLKKWKFDDPVDNSVLTMSGDWQPISARDWKRSKYASTGPGWVDEDNFHQIIRVFYVLYHPISVDNKGQEYTSKKVETYVRPVPTVTEKLRPIVVQEDLPLFKVNTADLTEEGKIAIMQALSNVTTAKSISIRGGASQEGTPERNKELCKLRSEAVAEFLKPTFPDAAITAEAEGDIQPKTPDTDEKIRKTFRKITMNVDGTTLVKQPGTKDETITTINTVSKRAQRVLIAATIIGIESAFLGRGSK